MPSIRMAETAGITPGPLLAEVDAEEMPAKGRSERPAANGSKRPD